MTFRQYIATLVDRYGTAGAVAKLVPMSESAFSRGVKNEGRSPKRTCCFLPRPSARPQGCPSDSCGAAGAGTYAWVLPESQSSCRLLARAAGN